MMKTGDRYVVRCIKKPTGLPEGNVLYAFEPGDYVNVLGFYYPVKDLAEAFVFTFFDDEHQTYIPSYFGDSTSEFCCECPEFFERIPVKLVTTIL